MENSRLTTGALKRGRLARLVRALVDCESRAARIALPLVTFAVMALIGVVLFRNERSSALRDIRDDGQLVREQLARRVEHAFEDELRPLRRLSRDIVSGLISDPERFNRACESVLALVPAFRQLIWIDASGVCQAAAPQTDDARGMVGSRLIDQPRWRVLGEIVNDQSRSLEGAMESSAPDEQVAVIPIYDEKGILRGMVAARLRMDDLLNQVLDDHTRSLFNIEMTDDAGARILSHSDGTVRERCCDVAESVQILNERWQIKVWPTALFLTRIPVAEAWRALIAMLVVGLLSALGEWQWMLYRRRMRGHARAIESLHEISAAIAAAPEQSRELLGRLTTVVAEMLKMPICLFNVYDPRDQTITVLHHVGDIPQPSRAAFQLRNLPTTVEAFRTGEPVFAEDVETASGPFDEAKLREYGIRSLLILPLMLRGEPVGSIALSDKRPHKLTPGDLRLAQLWASHAASIVASSELQRRTDQALRAQSRLLEQRETLYRVNTEIQRSRSLDESLQRIADLAPEALEVDYCAVALPAEKAGEFTIASVNKTNPPFPGSAGAVVRCVHAFSALTNGAPVVVEDARQDPNISQYGLPIGSAAYLPLATSTGTIGVLALYRREPATYTQGQMHFVELFAMRAAVVIENARLLEQTRRDAEAKAILLRELNHRVKNNLAGIVGLLSTSPVTLPEESRRWLDRVIDRIDSMSRVHELFVDGAMVVSAPELIRKSLEPVIAMCPPGVNVEFDLQGEEVRLLTNHAVTLAMALHELCFNALQHGVGESGSILIRSRVDEQNRMKIEVIDDGGGLAPIHGNNGDGVAVASMLRPPRTARHSGIGLSLVKGLVRRELHGEFELSPRTQGGTVATITFSGDERRAV